MAASDETTKATTPPSRVLGIDPGTIKMGWAVVERDGRALRHIDGGVFRPRRRSALPERLGELLEGLEGLLRDFSPGAVSVEAAFVGRNPRTALALGQARGLPIAVATRAGLAVHEYAPSVVKRAVSGSGRASKQQVRAMIQRLLDAEAAFAEDHADAAAVAIAALHVLHGPAVARPGALAARSNPAAHRHPRRPSPARDRLLAAMERAQVAGRRR